MKLVVEVDQHQDSEVFKMFEEYNNEKLQQVYHDYHQMIYVEGTYELDDLYFLGFVETEMEKRHLETVNHDTIDDLL